MTERKDEHHTHAPSGHNGHEPIRQWQTPHLPDGVADVKPEGSAEPDVDLVETAFLDSFPAAPDPTSFLRLAGVPFTAKTVDGRVIHLLRVEAHDQTDVGAITPQLNGAGIRYDPLPAAMTSRRRTLAFVYTDGSGVVRLSLEAARLLAPITEPRHS